MAALVAVVIAIVDDVIGRIDLVLNCLIVVLHDIEQIGRC